jgi:hypothetical protein
MRGAREEQSTIHRDVSGTTRTGRGRRVAIGARIRQQRLRELRGATEKTIAKLGMLEGYFRGAE